MIIISFVIIVFSVLILFSCEDSKKKDAAALLQEWQERVVTFPANPVFTILGEDTLDYQIQGNYKILTYVDSIGCTSCKLRLSGWKSLMAEVDSMQLPPVQFLFFLYPKQGTEIYQALRVDRFSHPICIDEKDNLNKLNGFPSNEAFQTFLLDKDNKVIAIGNPVHNPKVKDLFLKIIRGEKINGEDKVIKTKVSIQETFISLGTFAWQKEQRATFVLKNTGDKPLVIEGTNTSCGCTSAEYSKEPVRPGQSIDLQVTYKADHPEHFNKTITVYCNVENSLLQLTVSGDAK